MTRIDTVAELKRRPELAALPLLVVAVIVLPHLLFGARAVTPGTLVLGVAAGGPLALQAMGLLLIFRANRIINFAQVALGAVSALVFYELWAREAFVGVWAGVCSCLPADLTTAPRGLQVLNFVLSLLVGLVLAPLVGRLTYVLLIRRFESAPPLVLTMLSVSLAALLLTAANLIQGRLSSLFDDFATYGQTGIVPRLPLDAVVVVAGVRLHLADWLPVPLALAAAAGVAFYLHRTTLGVSLRAAADDLNRAETLGVRVGRVKAMAWTIAACLSALAVVIPSLGGQANLQAGDIGSGAMVQLLAIVIIARLRSIPMALAGALAIGICQEAVTAMSNSTTLFLGLLFPIIALFLLLQRRERQRAVTALASSWTATEEVRPIPSELRALPSVRHWLQAGGGIGALVVLGYPWIMPAGPVNLAYHLFIYAVVALSILVLVGWAGQISLGQFAIAAVGAMTTTWLTVHVHVPWPVSLLAGALAGTAVATVIAIPALRLPGLFLAATTLSLNLTLTSLALDPRFLGRFVVGTLDRPVVLGLDTGNDTVFYYLTLAFLAVVVAVVLRVRRSRTARALIACRDNEEAAQSFGIDLFQARLKAFALSGFLAALAGGVFAFAAHGTHAPDYSTQVSLSLFLVTLIGGLGSVWGPLIGMAFYGTVDLVVPQWAYLFVSGGVIVVFLFVPNGIGGLVFRIRDGLLRRTAIRHRIVVPSLVADYRDSGRRERLKIAPKLAKGVQAEALVPARYRVDSVLDPPTGGR